VKDSVLHDHPPNRSRLTLDKDLEKIARVELAARFRSRGLIAPGIGLVLLVLVLVFASFFVTGTPGGSAVVIAAAVIGAYMAINIGANDVANNVGPAFGARALSMGGALVLAALFESAGALIAGGDVIETVAVGIVDPARFQSGDIFVRAMLAALVSSALWVNLATWIGAPVSTTHSVVGGVVGAGIAAAGLGSVNWLMMGGIAASWVLSPLAGGVVAALFLAIIKTLIVNQDDKIRAARLWVPVLIAVMAGVFTTYLAIKGLHRIMAIDVETAILFGLAASLVCWWIIRPLIARQSAGLEQRGQSLRDLFVIPLIFSAALLSFAHGANDVANAVGPVAAIVHTVGVGNIAGIVSIPTWVMVIGAFGISFGLLLFGPKLIRMVGHEITRLNPMRAYCVALSTAITVIVASWLGLPVSSTHIAVGAVFGVGFFREWYVGAPARRMRRRGDPVRSTGRAANRPELRHRKLVRRSHFMTIVAAWLVTVPTAAALSAIVFLSLSAIIG